MDCTIYRLRQVKPKGAAFVSRALESVLRKFPVEASRMLDDGGVIRQVSETAVTRVMQLQPFGYAWVNVFQARVIHLADGCRFAVNREPGAL